jgi:hypothetical protein
LAAGADSGKQAIKEMVAAAARRYEFRRRGGDWTLMRLDSLDGFGVERLVNGRWIDVRRPRAFDDKDAWTRMSEKQLRWHARRYLLADLGAPGMGWQGRIRERFRRGALWRWAAPPLKGGATKGLPPAIADRSRDAYAASLTKARGEDLAELKQEALLGYEHQRARVTGVEQRANYFLGAAGLTTSLILANAGLLLGTGKLQAPWLGLAAGALALASVCAIGAGARALQASMVTFVRSPPNGSAKVLARRKLKGDELVRAYLGALLVAQARASAVGDWKIERLGSARRWFIGVIAGIVLLTVFVLAEAV